MWRLSLGIISWSRILLQSQKGMSAIADFARSFSPEMVVESREPGARDNAFS